jgi:hypothetical protein
MESGRYRKKNTHIDGTNIFQNEEDENNENGIAKILEREWGCEIRRWPKLHHIDWYAIKDGRISAFLELKCRYNHKDKYPTTYLPVAKWLSLQLVSAFGAVSPAPPGIFVVAFTDAKICWIPVDRVCASRFIFSKKGSDSGSSHVDRSPLQPTIEVPISDMNTISAEWDA